MLIGMFDVAPQIILLSENCYSQLARILNHSTIAGNPGYENTRLGSKPSIQMRLVKRVPPLIYLGFYGDDLSGRKDRTKRTGLPPALSPANHRGFSQSNQIIRHIA